MVSQKFGLLNNLKIRTLAFFMIALVLISGVIFVGSSVLVSSKNVEAQQIWAKYKADTSPKSLALNAIVEHLGYGGMIHHFKNYVIRKDEPRIAKFQVSAGAAIVAIERYGNTNPNNAEKKALDALRETVKDYGQKIEMVKTLAKDGLSASEIDKTVKISDKAALEGLKALILAVQSSHTGNLGVTKTELIESMRSGFGYGGMIHQFKNYILRQDAPRIEKVHKAMSEISAAMDKYRALKINAKEETALQNISGVVEAYRSGLEKASKLAQSGSTPEQIDKQVKVNDGPAIKGLANLVNVIGREMVSDGTILSADLSATSKITTIVLIVSIVSSLSLALLAYFVLFQKIMRPLNKITEAMTSLAEGDDDADVSAFRHKNEIGEMARAVDVFKDNAIERARLRSESEKDNEARAERQAKVDGLVSSFRETIQTVLQDVSSNTNQMETTANSLSSIATQTTSQVTSASGASEEASANVQTVAAATEELSASINEISRQIDQTTNVVNRASKATSATDTKIGSLAQSASKISEVLSLIQAIAEQTNLLALNATIEAARAGESGKGFAVVASEVKVLATQTANATEAISIQIADIQKETDSSVDAIREIADTMREVSTATEIIADSVKEQGIVTVEISNSVQQASVGSEEVSENISGVRRAAEENRKSAEQVLSTSQNVSTNADKLRSVVDEFLDNVAAA